MVSTTPKILNASASAILFPAAHSAGAGSRRGGQRASSSYLAKSFCCLNKNQSFSFGILHEFSTAHQYTSVVMDEIETQALQLQRCARILVWFRDPLTSMAH